VSGYAGALEAVDRILNRGGDADDVLRQVVAVLHERVEDYSWVGIAFVEGDALVVGPSSGEAQTETSGVPISYEGKQVAELRVATGDVTAEDRAFLDRVALLISPYCLVGWDTGGEAWSP
jgi:hypothetical protein